MAFLPRHISALPHLGETDIFRSLQLLPGIQMGTSGTADLFIRGGTPDQNLILLDGIPIYKPDHFLDFLAQLIQMLLKMFRCIKDIYLLNMEVNYPVLFLCQEKRGM